MTQEPQWTHGDGPFSENEPDAWKKRGTQPPLPQLKELFWVGTGFRPRFLPILNTHAATMLHPPFRKANV